MSKEDSLVTYLTKITLKPIAKRRPFSEPYVFVGEYLFSAQSLYESAAVLGYTFREKMLLFARLFSEPGQETNVIGFLDELVTSRLDMLDEEPERFLDLFLKTEVKRMHDARLIDTSDWLDI